MNHLSERASQLVSVLQTTQPNAELRYTVRIKELWECVLGVAEKCLQPVMQLFQSR